MADIRSAGDLYDMYPASSTSMVAKNRKTEKTICGGPTQINECVGKHCGTISYFFIKWLLSKFLNALVIPSLKSQLMSHPQMILIG